MALGARPHGRANAPSLTRATAHLENLVARFDLGVAFEHAESHLVFDPGQHREQLRLRSHQCPQQHNFKLTGELPVSVPRKFWRHNERDKNRLHHANQAHLRSEVPALSLQRR